MGFSKRTFVVLLHRKQLPRQQAQRHNAMCHDLYALEIRGKHRHFRDQLVAGPAILLPTVTFRCWILGNEDTRIVIQSDPPAKQGDNFAWALIEHGSTVRFG